MNADVSSVCTCRRGEMNYIADCVVYDSPVSWPSMGRHWPVATGVIMTSRRRPNVCVDRGSMDSCWCCVASVCTAAAACAAAAAAAFATAVFCSVVSLCVGGPLRAGRLQWVCGSSILGFLARLAERVVGRCAPPRRRPSIIDEKAKPTEFSFVGCFSTTERGTYVTLDYLRSWNKPASDWPVSMATCNSASWFIRSAALHPVGLLDKGIETEINH